MKILTHPLYEVPAICVNTGKAMYTFASVMMEVVNTELGNLKNYLDMGVGLW